MIEFLKNRVILVEAASAIFLFLEALNKWVYTDRQGELINLGKRRKPLGELELERYRIKRKLAGIKMERDIIKECAAYFARELR